MSNSDDAVSRALAGVRESFLAATGPGGQNVNKVASAVQLRVDAMTLGLAPDTFERLRSLAGSRMTSGGEIVLTARRYRTQEANRADARERLAKLVRQAFEKPAPRAKSRLNRVGKEARIKAKKSRGAVKAARGKVEW
jgi:ribosome-associated protein